MVKNLILFDLDGTIANIEHRLHLIDHADPDWDTFEDQHPLDPPLMAAIKAAQGYASTGLEVWLWTGRSDRVLASTRVWLEKHRVPHTQLLMRPYGDNIATTELKRRWLNDAPVPKHRVLCAYDDDPTIVRMLNEEGINVFQVKSINHEDA